jgi:PadR family transcriptional regulator, regulatory protein PadR
MKDDKLASTVDNITQELRRGSLVLVVLLESGEPRYGYSLVERLQERGIGVEQNTLYPLLRRLESQGLLESTWDTSTSRPRKYYRISEAGKAVAVLLQKEWRHLAATIEQIAADSAVGVKKEYKDEDH